MNNVALANQFIERISNVSVGVKNAVTHEATKAHIISILAPSLGLLVENFPNHAEDVQNRIVKFYTIAKDEAGLVDFIRLVEWYNMSLKDKPIEWFDPKGKYYGLRMSEIIDIYLMAKYMAK